MKATPDGFEVSLDAFILPRPHILGGRGSDGEGVQSRRTHKGCTPSPKQCTLEVSAEGPWLGLAPQSLSFLFGPGEEGGH